jgi:sec-independent protein translocase protein TatA
MPGGIGVPELAIILVIIVIIFGVGKLPEIGGALGKGIKEFKTESSSIDDKPIERGSSEPASSLTAPARERREEVVVNAGDRRERREVRAEEI